MNYFAKILPGTHNFILIFFVVFSTLQLSGQITITTNDMPSPGDTIRKSVSFSTAGIDFTLTGDDYVWDFSSLSTLYQSVDTFVSVSSVPFLYQFVFIPNIIANVAQKFPGIDTLGLPVTDPYIFFKNSSSSFNDVGFAITVNEIPIPLKFDDADIIYKFPVEYGNVDSSYSGVEFGINDLGFISIERKRVNETDGWGTLTTSYGTFDVLRMKSTVEETDSIYIDSLGFGTTLDRFYIEYKWMANGFDDPVLQITEEGPLVTVTWIDSIFDPFTNIAEPRILHSDISISPNPLSDNGKLQINLTDKTKVQLLIFNIEGIPVYNVFDGELEKGKHSFAINKHVSKLCSGIYFVRMNTNSEILTRKLIVR